jgi:hypothetical protein
MKAGEMLKATAELVGGQRAIDYGDKKINHQRIAQLWDMWLSESQKSASKGDTDLKMLGQLSAYDVAMMMLLVKVARLMHSPGHQDSHIDIAGYASILEEIASCET